MKLILSEDVEHLGKTGTVVTVKSGYARNFLIPRNLAVPATTNNMKGFEHAKRVLEGKLSKRMKEADSLKDSLEKVSCSITKKVGDQDKLFGSVTSADILEALEAEGFKLDKKDILLEEPIKTLGVFTVPIRVFEDVIANTKVWVVKE